MYRYAPPPRCHGGKLTLGITTGKDKAPDKPDEGSQAKTVLGPGVEVGPEDDQEKKPPMKKKEQKEILNELYKCLDTLKPPPAKKKGKPKTKPISSNVKVGGAIMEL